MQNGLPPAEAVARIGPLVAAGLGSIVAALAFESLREKELSTEEREKRTSDLNRRAERLQEIVKALENTEGDLMRMDKGVIPCKALENTEGELIRMDKEEETAEAAEEETIGQIRFEVVLARCRELEQLVTKTDVATGELLQEGIGWACCLLMKELRVATRRTQLGSDVEYCDGTKLDKLLKQPGNLQRVAARAGFPIPTDAFARLQASAEAGRVVRVRQKRADVKKAFLLLLRARGPWPWVAANSLVAVASGFLSAIALDYQAQMLETFRVDPKHARRRFRSIATAWAIIELCSTLLGIIGSQLSARGEKMASRLLQVQLFKAVARKELHWWEAKAESDVHGIDRLIRHHMPFEVSRVLNIPRDFLFRASSIVACAWRMRQQSNLLLLWMIGIHWTSVVCQKGVKRLKEYLKNWAYRGVVMPSQDDETFRFALRPEYASLYQSFVRGPKEARIFEQAVLNFQRCDQRMSAVSQLIDPASKVVNQGAQISQFAVVGDFVQQGRFGEGQARAMMHHAHEVNREIQGSYNDWITAQQKCSELAKAYDLITLKPGIDPDVGLVPEGRARGHIVFDSVAFEYPNRKGGKVLQGASFEVSPGQVIGIVGKTGCGKSTVFRLLQRFYDVDAGSISVDGNNVKDLNPEWLRTQIATVSQEPDLIPMTIRDNICIGCQHEPSAKEIEDACRAANIWDSLSDRAKFPEGLQTKMRAVKNVAGGEKQRICIARAILANPPILLLDEATSALDKTTENLVQEALEKLMQGRTTIVIAHRLSTIRNADTILGMRDGAVVEAGSHEELLRKSINDETCIYGKLWREQDGALPEDAAVEDQQAPASGDVPGRLSRLKTALKEAGRSRDVEKVRRATLEALKELEEEAAAVARDRARVALERACSAPASAEVPTAPAEA